MRGFERGFEVELAFIVGHVLTDIQYNLLILHDIIDITAYGLDFSVSMSEKKSRHLPE